MATSTLRRRSFGVVLVKERTRKPMPAAWSRPLSATGDIALWLPEIARSLHLSPDREAFLALYLDARNVPLGIHLVSVGILTASLVHPREVFAPALEMRAAGMVLIHNHPSGRLDPSPEDLAVTDRLQRGGEILGIRILDHLIWNGADSQGYVSFLERGLMPAFDDHLIPKR